MLIGFTDVDWVEDIDDKKPLIGYAFTLGNVVISWSSKKQPSVELLTTEVEYKEVVGATCEAIWLRYCDNQTAIKMTRNPIYHLKTKHVEIHHHYIKEQVHIKT